MKYFMVIILVAMSNYSMAAIYKGSPISKIASVTSYAGYSGDVHFSIENSIPECSDGYWFIKTGAGFEANLSMVIAAYHAKSNVIIHGLPAERWYGSNGNFCHLYDITYK